MSASAVRVRGLVRSYGTRNVLSGLDLAIDRGELISKYDIIKDVYSPPIIIKGNLFIFNSRGNVMWGR